MDEALSTQFNQNIQGQDEALFCLDGKQAFKQSFRIIDPFTKTVSPIIRSKVFEFDLHYSYPDNCVDFNPEWLPKISRDIPVHLNISNQQDVLELDNFSKCRVQKLSVYIPNYSLEGTNNPNNKYDKFMKGIKSLINLQEVAIKLVDERTLHTLRGEHSNIVNKIASLMEGTYQPTIEDKIIFYDD